MRPLFLLALLLLLAAPTALAQVRVEGAVVDAETGAALAGVHVYVEGDGGAALVGGVTNAEGRFLVLLPSEQRGAADRLALVAQHVGYQPTRLGLAPLLAERAITLRLAPAVLTLDDVFVVGEDFAENVLRKAIARRAARPEPERTHTASGVTRLTLARYGEPVLMHEAVFDRLRRGESGDDDSEERLVVRAIRQTASFHTELGFGDVGEQPDLSDARTRLHGLGFIGPLAPDALDHYVARFGGRRKRGERLVYDLYLTPKGELQPTFIGVVSILDSVYALVEADLRPARHVLLPPPLLQQGSTVGLAIQQRFAEVAPGAWLPVETSASGVLEIADGIRASRRVEAEQTTQFVRHDFGEPEARWFEQGERVVRDEASIARDPYFLQGLDALPLTRREQVAFDVLRRQNMTLRDAFLPEARGGLLTSFRNPDTNGPRYTWPTVLGYRFRFRYNRVDGFFSSIGQQFPLGQGRVFDGYVGQATGLSRIRYHAGLRQPLGRGLFAHARYHEDTVPWPVGSAYPAALTSLPTFFGGRDYFDYSWVREARAGIGLDAAPRLRFGAMVVAADYGAVERASRKAWPLGHDFRPNPATEGGGLTYVEAAATWVPPEEGAGYGLRAASLRVEQGASHAYTRAATTLHLRAPTLLRGRLRPLTLDVRLRAGIASDATPAQRLAGLDGSLTAGLGLRFAARGAFRSEARAFPARRYAAAFWEHRLLTKPFELIRAWPLVRTGTGLAVFGGHGWLRADGDAHRVHELGLALTEVGGLPVRFEVTRRLGGGLGAETGGAGPWFFGIGFGR